MVLRLSAWGIFLLGAVGLLIHSTLLPNGTHPCRDVLLLHQSQQPSGAGV